MTTETNTLPTIYPLTAEEEARLAESFTYHAPKGDQPARYTKLRLAAHTMAVLIVTCCPPGRERALALTKLEEAIMWANKGIACGEARP